MEDIKDIVEVTPLAGVWIEISRLSDNFPRSAVTPLAGVWIEIDSMKQMEKDLRSLPLRECGLKYLSFLQAQTLLRHSPCGSVD